VDEPTLCVRDGALVQLIPLTELVEMVEAARDIAEAAIARRDPDAVATAEAAIRQANRCKAAVSGYLLQFYMQKAQDREQARVVVAPQQQQNVAGEASTPAAAAPGAAAPPPGAAAPGPCQHPPDVACPNCAQAHMQARNARKRQGARA
jgi:hypothetical protein